MDWRGDLSVLWFKVESEIVAHRKTRLIPRDQKPSPVRTAAMGVWLFAAAWSAQHESDGFVPEEEFERWDPNADLTPYLVEVGYLEHATVGGERGYALHDWLDIQRSRAEMDADRVADAEKKRRMRAAKTRRNNTPPPDGPPGLPLDVPDYVPSAVPGGQGDGHPPGTPEGSRERVLSLEQSRVREEKTTSATAPRRRSARTARETAGPEFEAFYAAYPRHKEPEDAARAYLKARKAVGADELVTAAHRFAATRRGQDPKFTPYPASWLNSGGYADEPDPVHLAVVPNRFADLTYADLYDRADAITAAKLIRGVWSDPARKPSDPDPTPHRVWVLGPRREFIAANRDKICAALDARRAAG